MELQREGQSRCTYVHSQKTALQHEKPMGDENVVGSVNELANENEEKTRVFFFLRDASCNANCRFTQHKKTSYLSYIAYQ